MDILKTEWLYTTPLIIITVFMLTGYSPAYAAILGLATCIAILLQGERDPDQSHPGGGHGVYSDPVDLPHRGQQD